MPQSKRLQEGRSAPDSCGESAGLNRQDRPSDMRRGIPRPWRHSWPDPVQRVPPDGWLLPTQRGDLADRGWGLVTEWPRIALAVRERRPKSTSPVTRQGSYTASFPSYRDLCLSELRSHSASPQSLSASPQRCRRITCLGPVRQRRRLASGSGEGRLEGWQWNQSGTNGSSCSLRAQSRAAWSPSARWLP